MLFWIVIAEFMAVAASTYITIYIYSSLALQSWPVADLLPGRARHQTIPLMLFSKLAVLNAY
jgi:hypothetical protein